ncbi:hypothetical protein MTO96_040626, partial [Rhipicephalus appendiculatus]
MDPHRYRRLFPHDFREELRLEGQESVG